MFIQFLNGQMPMIPPGGMALAYVEEWPRRILLRPSGAGPANAIWWG